MKLGPEVGGVLLLHDCGGASLLFGDVEVGILGGGHWVDLLHVGIVRGGVGLI